MSEQKPLDMARFEPLTWDEQRSNQSHTYASQRLYAAMQDCADLLDECKRLTAENKLLRVAMAGAGNYEHISKTNAALEATK